MAISLGQLDLEALKNYLKIVQGFRTVEDPSGDTELVDGIDSSKIAIAALDESGDLAVKDLGRSVVSGALNLITIDKDGNAVIIKPEDLLTDEEGKALKDNALMASKSTAEDMRALRNEMYHLKLDMIKSGSIAYDNVYNGFIDPFSTLLEGVSANYTLDPVYVEGFDGSRIICEDSSLSYYKQGQHVILLSEGQVAAQTKIHSISDGYRLESAQWNKMPDTIVKTHGLYHDGKFVFATEGSQLVDTKNILNMIYKDGPSRISVATLNESLSQKGFVTTIMVPAGLHNNYLKSIGIDLRTKGAPGILYCELYEYTTLDKQSNRIFGEPIAISNNLSSTMVTSTEFNTYNFTFDNDILLEKGHEYVLVVKANSTSNNNVWEIGGFTEICNNAVHQDTYIYNTDGSLSPQKTDLLTNQVLDMFISLATTEVKTEELIYNKQGLYTGAFEIENEFASRLRISFNPDLNGISNPNDFDVYNYYTVSAIGRDNSGEYHVATPDVVDQHGRHQVKKFSHRVLANGKLSAYEYVFDFNFDEEVNYIEFQIVYNCVEAVGEDRHGALYAVVVSTDSAYIE